MTSDKTAIIGGVIILIGGLALAGYANTNAEALSQAKAKTVTKYISLSEKALDKGDSRQAEKFVIKALQTDPSNKQAIATFKKVELAGYKPAASSQPSGSNTPAAAPVTAPDQPQKPAPSEEAEEEMGCI